MDERVEALTQGVAEYFGVLAGDISLFYDVSADRVVYVVVDVGDLVGVTDNTAFECRGLAVRAVIHYAVTDFLRKVEAVTFKRLVCNGGARCLRCSGRIVLRLFKAPCSLFKQLHNPQALLVVREAHDLGSSVECSLPGMPERSMSEVMSERDRVGQRLVKPECARDSPRDLGYLKRVREARPVVVALRCQENLRLARKPPERLGMDDAIPVALKAGADVALLLGHITPERAVTESRVRAQDLVLLFFSHDPDTVHIYSSDFSPDTQPCIGPYSIPSLLPGISDHQPVLYVPDT